MKKTCLGGAKYTAQEFVYIGNRDCEEEPSSLSSLAGNAILAFLRSRRDRIGTEVRIMSITDARKLSIDVEAIIRAAMERHEEENKRTDEEGRASGAKPSPSLDPDPEEKLALDEIECRKARAELRLLELKIRVFEDELAGGKASDEDEADQEKPPSFDELLDGHVYQIKRLIGRARREAPSSEPWWL